MTTKEITLAPTSSLTPPPTSNRHLRYRMGKYLNWIGNYWLTPNLAAYRDFLLNEGLSTSTISVHLSTVRMSYRRLVRDRDFFYAQARKVSQSNDPVTLKTIVDEMIIRIRDACDPDAAKVDEVTVQDTPDSEMRRLTKDEADELLSLPNLASPDNLRGVRDTAIIAIALCTGIREGELVAIEVDHLHDTLDNEPALVVPLGKGKKKRVIPYGDLIWCRTLTERWLSAAGITSGPVFRGFWRGCKKVRKDALTTMGIETILSRYPFPIGEKLDYARPHMLRRTYASLMHQAGVDPIAIQQNLGHSNLRTTLHYIGPLDVQKRRPPAIFADVSG